MPGQSENVETLERPTLPVTRLENVSALTGTDSSSVLCGAKYLLPNLSPEPVFPTYVVVVMAWTYGDEGEVGKPVRKGKPCPVIDAVEFARTRLGIEPDARQIEVLQSNSKRGILNCSRQWGKS